MKRKKYLREKKKLKRILKKTALLKENNAYKRAWLLKYQTAIYNNGFHPAWGEPLTITHSIHGFKKTEEIVPLVLKVGPVMKRKEIERLNRWTKYKKYYAGENLFKLVIHERHGFYKFVMSNDDDDIYIATNYVAPATAVKLDETINEIMHKSAQYESLTEVYRALRSTFYGKLFYCGAKIAPQLTDGILLLSLSE